MLLNISQVIGLAPNNKVSPSPNPSAVVEDILFLGTTIPNPQKSMLHTQFWSQYRKLCEAPWGKK